jgi:hypothetical protein
LISFALFSLLAGCGDGRPARVPVSGQVLIDGRPLTSGTIRIVPGDARPATGTIDAEGRFTLSTFEEEDGCVPGTHGVEVTAIQSDGHNRLRRLVPEKYGRASTSGLTATIDAPTDSLVIELSSAGQQPTQWLDTAGDVDPAAR